MSYVGVKNNRLVLGAILVSLFATTLTALSIDVSKAEQECAVFNGVTGVFPDSTTVQDGSGDQSLNADAPIEQVYSSVELTPADVSIDSTESLPTFKCLYTTTPTAVIVPPTCNAYDANGILNRTPSPGTYPIRCEGGQYQNGYSPNLKSGLLTVTLKTTATPTPTSTPTQISSPTPSATPTSTKSPSATPSPTPTAIQPTVAEIDTNAALLPTGPQQTCTTFTGPDPVAVIETQSDGQIEGEVTTPEVSYAPIDIKTANYQIYENMPIPKFTCLIIDLPGKIVSLPLCNAFDGDFQLVSTPAVGKYEIRCREGQYLEGFQPLFRNSILTVLALPRVQKPAPSPNPTPKPSVNPTPSPTPTPSNNSLGLVRSFTLKSQDGENTSIDVRLPESLNNNRTVVTLDQNQFTSFVGEGIIFRLVINQSGRALTKLADPVLVKVNTNSFEYTPASSSDGKEWAALSQIASASQLGSGKNGYINDESNQITFAIRELNYFGLKRKQSPLTINFNSSNMNVGTTSQIGVVGGSGTGSVIFQSKSSSICSLSSSGALKAIKIGTCLIQANKEGDIRFLSAVTPITSISVVKSGTTAKTSGSTTSNLPKTIPASPATLSDFVILLDPRLEVTSKKVSLAMTSKSISLASGQITQIQLTGTDSTSQYTFTLILPTGGSQVLSLTSSKSSTPVLQSIQFLRKGTYQLLVRKNSSTQVNLISLAVK